MFVSVITKMLDEKEVNFIPYKLREHLFVHYNTSNAECGERWESRYLTLRILYFIIYCDQGQLQSINCDVQAC